MLGLSKGTATVDTARLAFFYDGIGQRIRKDYYHNIAGSIDQQRTGDVYIRDAQGHILAVYKHSGRIDGAATISNINNSMVSNGIPLGSLGNFFATNFAQDGTFVNSILDYTVTTGSSATVNFISNQLSPYSINYYYLNSPLDYGDLMGGWFTHAYTNMVGTDWQLLGNPLTIPGPDAHAYAAELLKNTLEVSSGPELTKVMEYMVSAQNEDFATEFCQQAGQTYAPSDPLPDRVHAMEVLYYSVGPDAFREFYQHTAPNVSPAAFLQPFLQDPDLFNDNRLAEHRQITDILYDALRNADPVYKEAHVTFMTNWIMAHEPGWLTSHMTVRKQLGIVFNANASMFLGSFLQAVGMQPVSNAVAAVQPMSVYGYYDMILSGSGTGLLPPTVHSLVAGASPAILQDSLYLSEHHLYGSNRLGVKEYDPEQYRVVYNASQQSLEDGLGTAQPWYSMHLEELIKKNMKVPSMANRLTDTISSRRWLGSKHYELTDHLGNVLVTFLDRKTGYGPVSGLYTGYKADVASTTDYYPFGFAMAERTKDGYRFGFNGQEKTDEIAGQGNHNTALFWEYDTRVARRWNLDPKPSISISQYSVYLGDPIINKDFLGDTTYMFSMTTGKYLGMANLNVVGSFGLVVDDSWVKKKFRVDVPFEFADPFNDPTSIREGKITNAEFANNSKMIKEVRRGVGGRPKDSDYGPYDGAQYLMKHSDQSKNDGLTDYSFTSEYFDDDYGLRNRTETLIITTVGTKVVAHNNFNFGNFLWGASAAALGVPLSEAKLGAHYNNYMNDPGTKGHLDSPDDQYSIKLGWSWWKRYEASKNGREIPTKTEIKLWDKK